MDQAPAPSQAAKKRRRRKAKKRQQALSTIPGDRPALQQHDERSDRDTVSGAQQQRVRDDLASRMCAYERSRILESYGIDIDAQDPESQNVRALIQSVMHR